ncbi:MAG: flagellar hook assembly protein FlgD [Minwuia sp.]|uniref:flagellar hook assembly protein FlgD n=1 Tax=Minwuia sp. TaxID=2493630 RepID=UPI003A85A1D5
MDLASLGLPTIQNGAAGAATRKLSEDFDTFLTLLTSQLKNQDPLEPLKSEQFTQQLVQFSQVEQQIATNDQLESLVSLSLAAQHGALVDYIGKTVEGESNRARLTDGEAGWTFDVDGNPERVSILILDENNRAVRSDVVNGQAGLNRYNWDGLGDNGNELADGVYRISISAADRDGGSIPVSVRASGTVDGVEVVGGVAQLSVNGAVLPLSSVTSVSGVPVTD